MLLVRNCCLKETQKKKRGQVTSSTPSVVLGKTYMP